MALALRSLQQTGETVVGDASGNPTGRTIRTFVYATDDAVATVETAGYFNGARAFLVLGSTIKAVMVLGGSLIFKEYVVTAVPATGNVTVAAQTVA